MKPQKKTYTTPKVINYGDVRKITQAIGTRNSVDGGPPPKQKTSV